MALAHPVDRLSAIAPGKATRPRRHPGSRAILAGAVAAMVLHTGPLLRPELLQWGLEMTRITKAQAATHRYAGMWVTADGHIRHELLPNGRYDEQRGTRRSAYRGRYAIVGNHIDYVDDTGFTADGDFIDGVLHHGGMLFYRAQ